MIRYKLFYFTGYLRAIELGLGLTRLGFLGIKLTQEPGLESPLPDPG
jgi:hypothetical protein